MTVTKRNSASNEAPDEASEAMLSKRRGNESGGEEGTHLRRELGLLDGASIIIGIIVGSGIFVSPKGVLQYSGSVGMSLIVWLLSGILSMIGAICYAELGTMIPKSGGDYAYILESFGPLPAFLYLWAALLMIMPAGNAITALTFANYILQPFWPECDAPREAVRLLAAIIICFLTFVNCYNVKAATKVQDVFTATKVFALIGIILAGVVYMTFGRLDNLANPMADSDFRPGQIALAFYSGLFSYAGWNYLNFVTEELREPNKNLPRAIYISLPLVTVIYLLANVAYFAVLTPLEIIASNAVAVTFADRLIGSYSWIMSLCVACSTFGAVNGGIFASSRLFFVGARNSHMPRAMALINVQSVTPMPCLIFLGLCSLAMLITDDVYELINYTSFIESLFITVSVAGLLWLRYKDPDRERPIKVNLFYPVTFFVICGFLVLMPAVGEPRIVAVDLLILAVGVVFYFVFIRWRSKPIWVKRALHSFDIAIQKLFLAVPEE